ncbi:hypothetical protein FB381_2850 [Nocardioides albertanoniae]|uniref:Uncharacterized protein n=1 Tax=Nocardioides albertanoniae TaxID=1175486 RepID=A0A543A8T6_9ACTN|nr:hypothetical protein [Nocardioides albertanoniae]TQL68949.1 hypothetical protein FB381_2850 [Nocardioides albertanoniae]
MPMPPPRPTGRPHDRQTVHEVGQIVRALKEEGPLTAEELATLVGARFWKGHRFDRALNYAVGDGVVVRDADGRLHMP